MQLCRSDSSVGAYRSENKTDVTLEDCLNLFAQEETLSPDDAW